MSLEIAVEVGSIGPKAIPHEEVPMVRQERWQEIRPLWIRERVPIAQIARQLDLDRKTVRRCIRDTERRAYQRPARPDTLLTPHADFLRARAPQVRCSAQILFQELRQRGYRGSYDKGYWLQSPDRVGRPLPKRSWR